MKFAVIFAFVAVVAACFMLPTSEAAITTRDADAMSSLMNAGASLGSGFIKSLGDGMNSMMDAGTTVAKSAEKAASDGMKDFAKNMQSFVPGGDNKGAADAKTDKKA